MKYEVASQAQLEDANNQLWGAEPAAANEPEESHCVDTAAALQAFSPKGHLIPLPKVPSVLLWASFGIAILRPSSYSVTRSRKRVLLFGLNPYVLKPKQG